LDGNYVLDANTSISDINSFIGGDISKMTRPRIGKKAVPELYEIKLTPPIPKNFFKKKKKVKK